MSAKSSSIWLMLEKVVSLGLSLVITMVLARYLAPKQFGELNYLISLVALVGPLSALGLNSIITREVVNRPDDREKILGSSFLLRLIVGVIVSLIASIVTWFSFSSELWLGFVILLIGQCFQSLLVFDFWIQAEVLNRTAAKMRSAVLFVMSLIKLFGVWQAYSLNYFIVVTALEMAVICVGLLVIYQHKTAAFAQLYFCKKEAKSLLSQSWWLFLSGMAAIIYLKIDQVMLGWLADASEVGIYAVAAKLSEVWYFFPIAIVTSYFPQLLNYRESNNQQYQMQLQKLCDILCMSALSLAIATQIFAPWGVTLLFGEAYQASAYVLAIHIWAGVFIFMRALLSKWLLAENLLRFSLLTQVLGAVMNVLGNALLIPAFGAQGAAVATVIGYFTASYLALFCHRDIWPMAKIMTASLIWPIRWVMHRHRLYQ